MIPQAQSKGKRIVRELGYLHIFYIYRIFLVPSVLQGVRIIAADFGYIVITSVNSTKFKNFKHCFFK